MGVRDAEEDDDENEEERAAPAPAPRPKREAPVVNFAKSHCTRREQPRAQHSAPRLSELESRSLSPEPQRAHASAASAMG